MSIRKLSLTTFVALLLGLSAIFAWDRLSIQRVSAEDQTVYENLQIFSDVLDIVKENYVQEVETEPERLREAPHTRPVRRLDEVRAAKHLDLVWTGAHD